MKILSVNVGLPREVTWQGKLVTTGIFKDPIQGRVMMRRLNLDGDQQADLTVHGGVSKAVYLYPSEHYGYWRTELPGMDLPWGMFGENFTAEPSHRFLFCGDAGRNGWCRRWHGISSVRATKHQRRRHHASLCF